MLKSKKEGDVVSPGAVGSKCERNKKETTS